MLRRFLALAIAVYAAAAIWLFVVPHGSQPAHADAVVVLEGSKYRLPVGLRLMREGYAPLLVLSVSPKVTKPERAACRGGAGWRVFCFHAHPFSTRGEAEEIGRLARAHRWHSVDVVTSNYHVFRARILVRRCYHGRLRVVAARSSNLHLPIAAVEESIKLAYQELVVRDC